MAKYKPLKISQLRKVFDPEKLWFDTTAEVDPPPHGVMGQERAVDALDFGMGMNGSDYNVYVAGPREAGMGYISKALVSSRAKKESAPPDWAYVHNFKNPDAPTALRLRQGQAAEFVNDMDELIDDVKTEIPEIFESDDYSARRDELVKRFGEERTKILGELEEKVKAEGFLLNMSQVGMMIVPAKDEGPLDEADLAKMSDDEKEALKEKSNLLQTEMTQAVRVIKKMEKGLRGQLKDLDRRVALFAVGHLIDELQEKYSDQKSVLAYLKAVKDDIILNIDDFKQKQQQQVGPFPVPQQEVNLSRYEVNALVDNSECEGAPVVVESNPTFANLFGTMERRAQFGALFTDFTMIRPGSIHRANGGYLIIRVTDLLKWWISYEALKRSLQHKEIYIEDPAEMLGFMTTKGMKPEPIPLDVKVILLGDPMYYQLLYAYDEAFAKLFKVKAHLDTQASRKQARIREFSTFLRQVIDEHDLLQADRTGVAALIEDSSVRAGTQDKLTLQLGEVADLIREADYWARKGKAETIGGEHVNKAIDAKMRRANLYEERLHEVIIKDIIHVATKGHEVGQVNGLSVFMMGDYAFGRPSRITATVSLGKGGAVSIDRESKMSGSIHTKGVLILEGYLRGKYAQNIPLSLTATLAFEQSYGMVDGDSASGAEAYAIISALADLPINQGIACTGAISQRGELQAIGGVNHKIEGHFRVCQSRGLTGEQGVIIPKSNIRDLMLRQEVIDAVEEGKFSIWAVDAIDKAMDILMGVPAGKLRKDGTYPPKSIHGLAMAKLEEMAEKVKGQPNGDRPKGGDDAPACASCGK